MRLTSENREKIAYAVAWTIFCILIVPAWVIERITVRYFPKLNRKIDIWIDIKFQKIYIRVDTWINDTPEKTMELLKQGGIKK